MPTVPAPRPMARDPRAWALILAATLTILSNATISPALPGLEASFADHSDAARLVRLLVTAPALAVALIAPFAGIITDRFSRRRLLLGGIALYAVAGTVALNGVNVVRCWPVMETVSPEPVNASCEGATTRPATEIAFGLGVAPPPAGVASHSSTEPPERRHLS